jgi:hypothetical protein
MTLNPSDDIVAQIIKSYEGYAATLSAEMRKHFYEMLNSLYELVEAIKAKDEPFAEETALVTLVLKQHLIIEDLKEQAAILRKELERRK